MREISLEEFEPPCRLTLEKAQKAISGKYFHYARALLLGLLDHYPNCPELRLKLRQVTVLIHERGLPHMWAWLQTTAISLFYLFRHSPLRQINSLERVLLGTPDFVWAHRKLAKIAFSKELWKTAVLSLEAIVTLNPGATRDKILLSKAYLKTGKTEEAQSLIRSVLGQPAENTQPDYSSSTKG